MQHFSEPPRSRKKVATQYINVDLLARIADSAAAMSAAAESTNRLNNSESTRLECVLLS